MIVITKFEMIIKRDLVALLASGSSEKGLGWIKPLSISCCENISFVCKKNSFEISIPINKIVIIQKIMVVKINFRKSFLLFIKTIKRREI